MSDVQFEMIVCSALTSTACQRQIRRSLGMSIGIDPDLPNE